MRWNSYLEECLEKLQECNEYNTDILLVKYVRLQQMAEKISSSHRFDDTNRISGWKLCPPTLYIKALQGELQALKNNLQTEYSHNSRFYYAYTSALF